MNEEERLQCFLNRVRQLTDEQKTEFLEYLDALLEKELTGQKDD